MPVFLVALSACMASPDALPGRPPAPATRYDDADRDGVVAGPDCDDDDPDVHPGASEICNDGRDDDCDPLTIEAVDLASVAVAPDGATVQLCPGTLAGNLLLDARRLTLRGGDGVVLGMAATDRPVIDVVGGQVVLEDLVVRGTPVGYYNQASALRVTDGGHLTVRDSTLTQGIGVAGGAIRVEAATLLVEDSDLLSNRAVSGGGAIAAFDARVEIRRSQLRGNACSGCAGGAIRVEGGTLVLSESTLSENRADAGEGGAISATDAAIALSDVTLHGNVGAPGGALAATTCDLTVLDVDVRDNVAPDADGGGLFLAGGTAQLTNVALAHNSAGHGGGGVHAQGTTVEGAFVALEGNAAVNGGGLHLTAGAVATARGWTVRGNTGDAGGGLNVTGASFLGDAATVVSENAARIGGGAAVTQGGASLVAGAIRHNTATDQGGGAWVRTFGPDVSVHASIHDNTAASGGGVAVAAGSAEVRGAVYANTATSIGGGIFLETGAGLAGACDWGADTHDNLVDDVASDAGLRWSTAGWAEVTCTHLACEVGP